VDDDPMVRLFTVVLDCHRRARPRRLLRHRAQATPMSFCTLHVATWLSGQAERFGEKVHRPVS
jgi:hypothetical protein